MSADPNTPLFVISDGDNVEYEDDPTVTQAKVNLAAVERMQQESAEGIKTFALEKPIALQLACIGS